MLCNVFVSFSLGLLSADSEVTTKGTPLDTLSSYLSQKLAYGKGFCIISPGSMLFQGILDRGSQ